jgi:hypothetical protein
VGRDNHPRERQARALARKKGTKPPYDRILIVCEGSKTEPLYFHEIRREVRANSAHINIMPSAIGTEPRQVVDYALQKFLETRSYEWVFAVFDRDIHRTFHDALVYGRALDNRYKNDEKRTVRFMTIPSIPCFELWLLLHFVDIQALFPRDEILRRLVERIPGYTKGLQGTYQITAFNLDSAIARAKRLQGLYTPENDTEGPYTNVDVVVDMLRSIKGKTR